jgi:hypothetical protein
MAKEIIIEKQNPAGVFISPNKNKDVIQLGELDAFEQRIKKWVLEFKDLPVIIVPNADQDDTPVTSQILAPNTLYVFTDRTNDLTLTLGEPLVGKVSEYHCFIVAGETAPTVHYPDGITWNGGNAPTIAANKIYEISILGNVAAFFEVEPATQS